MFLQHLVDRAHDVVRSERKLRRNIQYKDIATAVARVENLEFLADVVPKTTTYKQHRQKAAAAAAGGAAVGPQTNGDAAQMGGQMTLTKDGGLKAQEKELDERGNGDVVGSGEQNGDAMEVDDDDRTSHSEMREMES